MKTFTHHKWLYASICLCLILCGCSRSYWQNRVKDASDCVTLTWGLGMGANAMVGPLNTGLGVQWDVAGIRDGTPISGMNSFTINTLFIQYTGIKGKAFGFNDLPTRTADYAPQDGKRDSWATLTRNRAYFENKYPLVARMVMNPAANDGADPEYHARQYYTQIEVSGGVIFSGIRMGANPGELVDFLLGFFGVDIYGDDLYPYATLSEKKKAAKHQSDGDKFQTP